jgi:hypothetical protein
MKLALQLLETQYDLLGAVPIMWGPSGWAESYSTNPGSPDFTVFENGPWCMLYASFYVSGDLLSNQAIRIVCLPDFTSTTDANTTLSSRIGSINFGARDSIDANTYVNSLTAYSRFGPIQFASFGQFKNSSGGTLESSIQDCGAGATPDIIIFYT